MRSQERFEFTMHESDDDWKHTKVGFVLANKNSITQGAFHHTSGPPDNPHYKISSYCWAMYLRILKRYIEFGEKIPYEKRLSV